MELRVLEESWNLRRGFEMINRFIVLIPILMAVLAFSSPAFAQTARPRQPGAVKDQKAAPSAASTPLDGWGRPVTASLKSQKEAPAPRHDISGTWEPAAGPGDGIQGLGAKAMPEDGKPEHEPPYTPLGLELLKTRRVGNGVRQVLPGEINDPVVLCDPQGLPREDLYELRTTQILQTPLSVVILYEFDKIWRVLWTDGRELPKDPEPRWFGYSAGKWEDDYTLAVQTSGTDERTWVDKAGRPHSGDLRVEERFHRVDHDHLELTVTINDPKMYTKPWIAVDRLPFQLQTRNFDVREMICSPTDFAEYNKLIGNPASNKDSQ